MSSWDSLPTVGGSPAMEDKPAPAAPAKPDDSVLGNALKPLKAIPGDIASEFRAGAKMANEGLSETEASLKSGAATPIKGAHLMPALKFLGGGLQELMSPITGTAKAVVGDPLREVLPKNIASQMIANTAEMAANLFGPGIAAKVLTGVADYLPKLTSSVKLLMDEGVDLTIGHMANRESAVGKVIKGGEDKAASVPVAGSFIKAAQERMFGDFNKAVVNRALRIIGDKVPGSVKAGRDLIAYAQKAIGSRYDALLPRLVWGMDAQLDADMARMVQRNPMVPWAQQNQFNAVVKDVRDRLISNPHPTGAFFKEVESEISALASSNKTSPLAMEQQLGHMLDNLNASLRSSLARVNPLRSQELGNLNDAWAVFKRAEGASVRRKTSGGVFTPADLLQDIGKNTSQSVFARGDGMLQDLAQAGQDVLPSEIPNSGTIDRGLWAALLSGSHFVSPEAAIAGAGMTAPYLKTGQKLINSAVRAKPLTGANRALGASGPFAGVADIVGPQLMPEQKQ